MKYLTKDWYETCQRTGLHYGMRVHRGAGAFSETLYQRLYRRKEKAYIQSEHEIYNFDPRYFHGQDGSSFVPADKFARGEEIKAEDILIYQMPEEEKEQIQKMIEAYDHRSPFDVEKCKQEFRVMQETSRMEEAEERITDEILMQIADLRVFCLGYCTKEVKVQLERVSRANGKIVKLGSEAHTRAQKAEDIPESIRKIHNFHDSIVLGIGNSRELDDDFDQRGKDSQQDNCTNSSNGSCKVFKDDFLIQMDAQGGFTDFNKVTFRNAEIIKQESIIGSRWLYCELYRIEKGYEVHILFWGEGMPELILTCSDILMEIE